MTLVVTHPFVSPKPQGNDSTRVYGPQWNANHTLTGAADASQLNANVVQAIVSDTNVTGSIASQTLTLGWTGTADATRLNSNVVQAVTQDTNIRGSITAQNLTFSWLGQLGLSRGGTNADLSATGGAGQYLKQASAAAAVTVGTIPASDIASGAAITKVDDTNVTLTLGGTPASAALKATSLTLGWIGTLAIARGGTGAGTQQAAFDALAPTATRAGDLTYWNGTHYVNLAGNNSGTKVLQEDASGVPSWVVAAGTGTVTSIATTYPLSGGTITNTGTLTSVAPPACGRLTFVSTTAVKFSPYNGDLIKINGVLFQIPAAGIAGVANTSVFVNGTGASNLAASTFYYMYAFSNGGTVTADFRTDGNGHLPSDTSGNIGVEVRVSSGTTKDDTRTLIGAVATNGSSQFQNSATVAGVISWFNRLPIGLKNNFTTTRTNATAVGAGPTPTFTEVNTEIRISFLCWSTDAVTLSISGSFFNSGVNTNLCSVGVDSTSVGEDVFAVMTGTSAQPLALTHVKAYAEGSLHFATVLNGVSAGTASYYVFGNAAGGRTTLNGALIG